jgi:hypothetical protein
VRYNLIRTGEIRKSEEHEQFDRALQLNPPREHVSSRHRSSNFGKEEAREELNIVELEKTGRVSDRTLPGRANHANGYFKG